MAYGNTCQLWEMCGYPHENKPMSLTIFNILPRRHLRSLCLWWSRHGEEKNRVVYSSGYLNHPHSAKPPPPILHARALHVRHRLPRRHILEVCCHIRFHLGEQSMASVSTRGVGGRVRVQVFRRKIAAIFLFCLDTPTSSAQLISGLHIKQRCVWQVDLRRKIKFSE